MELPVRNSNSLALVPAPKNTEGRGPPRWGGERGGRGVPLWVLQDRQTPQSRPRPTYKRQWCGVVHRGLEGMSGLLRLLHDLAQAFHRGVLRLFYFHKFRVAQEGSQRAVGAVGIGLVPHVGFHAEPAQTGGLENGMRHSRQPTTQARKAADQGKAAETGLAPQQHAHHHHPAMERAICQVGGKS